MKLIKKMVNKIRLAYYNRMIGLVLWGYECARDEDDPESMEYWDNLYAKYQVKIGKLLDKDH